MGVEEREEYLAEVNRAFPWPMQTCYWCERPIEDECVVHTSYDPPVWLHLECRAEAYGDVRNQDP